MKLSDIQPELGEQIPVEDIEGLFLTNITLGKLEELQNMANSNPDGPDLMLWMGEHLLRDEDGQPFEDLATREEVLELPFTKVTAITEAVRRTMESMTGNVREV